MHVGSLVLALVRSGGHCANTLGGGRLLDGGGGVLLVVVLRLLWLMLLWLRPFALAKGKRCLLLLWLLLLVILVFVVLVVLRVPRCQGHRQFVDHLEHDVHVADERVLHHPLEVGHEAVEHGDDEPGDQVPVLGRCRRHVRRRPAAARPAVGTAPGLDGALHGGEQGVEIGFGCFDGAHGGGGGGGCCHLAVANTSGCVACPAAVYILLGGQPPLGNHTSMGRSWGR